MVVTDIHGNSMHIDPSTITCIAHIKGTRRPHNKSNRAYTPNPGTGAVYRVYFGEDNRILLTAKESKALRDAWQEHLQMTFDFSDDFRRKPAVLTKLKPRGKPVIAAFDGVGVPVADVDAGKHPKAVHMVSAANQVHASDHPSLFG